MIDPNSYFHNTICIYILIVGFFIILKPSLFFDKKGKLRRDHNSKIKIILPLTLLIIAILSYNMTLNILKD